MRISDSLGAMLGDRPRGEPPPNSFRVVGVFWNYFRIARRPLRIDFSNRGQ